jgi:hypothetical protein
MEEEIRWRFPGNGGTKKNGLDTTDFHTFMDDAAASLAREICQNSNDAIDKDLNKPAIVEFHSFDIKTSSIPHLSELMEELQRCYEYWKDDNQEIAGRLKDMTTLLKAERINVLRISDFNTTGLLGVNQFNNEKSPWYSLMHGSGESSKGESEGGSKGVGKYATFVNSLVRTVFYSTKAKDGESGHQGISCLCSSKVKDSTIGELTQGIGYLGIDNKNDPISGELDFDPSFTRKPNENGTDIYIIGFNVEKGWKQDIISKVLDSFMVAILYGRLEVVVDDIKINKSSIKDVVFDESLIRNSLRKSVVSQYVLLSNDPEVIHKTLSIEYDGKEVSKAELYFKRFQGEEQRYATNACSMVRYPFMKIKDIKGIVNSSMTSSAICIIPDGPLTHFLKESENPEHTDWIIPRIKDVQRRAIVDGLYTSLKDKIQNTIIECLRTPESDETDAIGASKYLPEYEKGKEKPAEKAGKPVEKPIISKPSKKRTSEINTYYEDPNGNGVGMDVVEESASGDIEELHPSGHNNSTGGDKHQGEVQTDAKKDDNGNEAFVRQQMKGITYHFVCTDKAKGEYMISFVSPKAMEKAEFVLNMLDESSEASPVEVLSGTVNGQPATIEGNRIVCFPIKEGELIRLLIKTNMTELFSAEVHLYVTR